MVSGLKTMTATFMVYIKAERTRSTNPSCEKCDTGVCNWRYGAKSSSTADLEAPKYLFPASAELGMMYN